MSTATAVPIIAAPLVHSGATTKRFYRAWLTALLFPLTSGVIFYGWRTLGVVAAAGAAAMAGTLVWRRVGPRGPLIPFFSTLISALLLALTLPALPTRGNDPIVIAAFAGLTLAFVSWLVAGRGWARLHPTAAAHLVAAALFAAALVPNWTLQRSRAVLGDLRAGGRATPPVLASEPWMSRPPMRGQDAVWAEPASQELLRYTTGREWPQREALPLQSLIRDHLPPLEDLVVGGHPGPIGTSSAIAVIVGGLFLLYRHVIDFRIPLWIVISAYITLVALPTPTAVGHSGPTHTWFASFDPRVQWVTGITFVHYELMASPLLFMAFFLATWPAVRPMSRRSRMVYAALIGIAAAAAQMYVSTAHGPYLALLLVNAATPLLERLGRGGAVR